MGKLGLGMSNNCTYLLLSQVRARSLAHVRCPPPSLQINGQRNPSSPQPPHIHRPLQRKCVHTSQSPNASLEYRGQAFPEKTRTHCFFVLIYGGGRIEIELDDRCVYTLVLFGVDEWIFWTTLRRIFDEGECRAECICNTACFLVLPFRRLR